MAGPQTVMEVLMEKKHGLTPHEARLKRIAALRGKTLEDVPARVAVNIDEDILRNFKLHSQTGIHSKVESEWPQEKGYVCLINEVLREWLEAHNEPMLSGDSCVRLRSSVGLSQGELARMAGVSRQAVSDFERGQKQTQWRIIRKIATALENTNAGTETPVTRGQRLREQREALKLTMTQVARKAGISRRTLYLLETGGRSRLNTIKAVKQVLTSDQPRRSLTE